MFKNKKLEVRLVTDTPQDNSGETDADKNDLDTRIQNYMLTRTFIQDTAWIIGSIMILKFSLRIAEHVIVTKLKY